jgi:putative phosphoribosyl transferase
MRTSTLLIVGSKDSKTVIELNKKVLRELKNADFKQLILIPDAGHLFEENGAIEEVSKAATKWFFDNL